MCLNERMDLSLGLRRAKASDEYKVRLTPNHLDLYENEECLRSYPTQKKPKINLGDLNTGIKGRS